MWNVIDQCLVSACTELLTQMFPMNAFNSFPPYSLMTLSRTLWWKLFIRNIYNTLIYHIPWWNAYFPHHVVFPTFPLTLSKLVFHLLVLVISSVCREIMCKIDEKDEKHIMFCRVIFGNSWEVWVRISTAISVKFEFLYWSSWIINSKLHVVCYSNMNTHILPLFIVSYKYVR